MLLFRIHSPIGSCCVGFAAMLCCGSLSVAQTPQSTAIDLRPVIVDPVPGAESNPPSVIDDAVSPKQYRSSDLPASITADNELLPLAPAGAAVLPALPMKSAGCSPRPLLECTGPDYCGCSPRLYYGTQPCDDDPILPLYPSITGHKTAHWYQHAFNMVLRKKTVTEVIK